MTAANRLLDASTIFAIQASELEEQFAQQALRGLREVQDAQVARIQQVPVNRVLDLPAQVSADVANSLRSLAGDFVRAMPGLARASSTAYPRFLNRAITGSEATAYREQFIAPPSIFDPDEVAPADELDLQEDFLDPLQDFFLAWLLMSLRWQFLTLEEQWELMIQRQQIALRTRIAGALAQELQDATDGVVPDTKVRTVVARELVNGLMGTRTSGARQRASTSVEALARTQVQAVLDAVIRATHEQNSRMLAGEIWSAILDSRTCMRCASLHGNFYPIKDSKSTIPEMPLHPLCRCYAVPVLRKVRGVDSARPLLPAIERFPEWLARQPESLQRKLLGPKRLRLYRAGQLELKDFLQFRRKVPIRVRRLDQIA